MPTQIDALGAFAYLSDNLPTWISRLSDLTAHTNAKHAEFAEAFKQHSTAPRTRRRKNSSVCSIDTSSVRGKRRRGSGGSASPEDNTSSASGDGPAVISTRHNLVIHYDGHTQKVLEEMVRNIGTARNNLRKGKMAQLPGGGFGVRSAPPRSGSRALLPSLGDSPEEDLMASIRASRMRGPPTPQAEPTTKRTPPFDLADKNLELAHSFCETAAYSFLRTGDCATELNSVNDRFTVLLKLAKEEVQLLEKEKADQSDEAESTSKDTETEQPPSPVSLKRPAASEGVIEVDDEQESVESIDLSTFRINRMRR
ncbi:hypothetical protein BDV18DRAFT_147412 [Aspergillus unguis]